MFTILKRVARLRIGLDIQPDAIRLLALSWEPPYRVQQFGEVMLPELAIRDGKCHDYDQLNEALQALSKQTETQGRAVQIALPFRGVVMKTIYLPQTLSPLECEIEIETHLSHYLPGASESMQFDFIPLSKGARDQAILLVATKNEIIEFYCDIVRGGGFSLRAVDVDIYALTRALMMMRLLDLPIQVLVDFSFDVLSVIVLQHRQIIFNEQLAFTKNTSHESIAHKIQQSLRICCSMNHDVRIQKIIFSGSHPDISLIANYFSDRTVLIYEPNTGIQTALQDKASRYARAIGLALWSVPYATD